jgi:hypothetical protein
MQFGFHFFGVSIFLYKVVRKATKRLALAFVDILASDWETL